MSDRNTHEVLNRLLTTIARSLPMYLTHARPWAGQGDQRSLETLEGIVADQKALCERINAFIVDTDGVPEDGEFPMDLTDLHDLSLDYIVRVAASYQQRDIAVIEQCVEQLRLAPLAKELAEEALGLAKGHLELLEDLARQPA